MDREKMIKEVFEHVKVMCGICTRVPHLEIDCQDCLKKEARELYTKLFPETKTPIKEAVAKQLYEFGLRLTNDRIVSQDKWEDLAYLVKESWRVGAVSIINIFKEQGWRPPESEGRV